MVSREEITSELNKQPRAQATESRDALDVTPSNEKLAHFIDALQRSAHLESDGELREKLRTANTRIVDNMDKSRHKHLATSDRCG